MIWTKKHFVLEFEGCFGNKNFCESEKKGMVDLMEKAKIIMLKREGISTREISWRTGMSRDTIAKYWREFI